MSEIRAVFEQGIWQDFSKEHRALREEVQSSLGEYRNGKFRDPVAVWGAFGAGKTQFLFWVAEESLSRGLVPVYFHLNDVLDGLDQRCPPEAFRDRVHAFVERIIEALWREPHSEFLLRVYRDQALLSYVLEGITNIERGHELRPVLLIDEVEQAYASLQGAVRADDRSPLRAWLEDPTFKVCAFAVGSLYVLGKADRERLRIRPIPAVRPSYAKRLLPDIPERAVNSLWWLSRGKPRHLMKAAQRFRTFRPEGPIEINEFVKDLDAVSQAPYETDSQNVVPSAYIDHFQPEELGRLLSIGPEEGGGDGKLFQLGNALEAELLPMMRDVFRMEAAAVDVVRYIVLLLEAVSVDGCFSLSESDTGHLIRLAVDFLLEYERERLEKETIEGGAALRKLLETHDSAEKHAGQIFWKLQGKLKASIDANPALSFAAIAAAFPLPTTSPTLIGTNPAEARRKYHDAKQPIFSWRDPNANTVLFFPSTTAFIDYSESDEFRQFALSPNGGVIALLPYDCNDWHPTGFIEWLIQHSRASVLHLPLALTDFLLSLRDWVKDGSDPFPIAERAESDRNLQRQISFYRSRLKSFVSDAVCRPAVLIPSAIPKRLNDTLSHIADRNSLTVAVTQAFETISPQVLGFLVDLRDLVMASKPVWGRSGYVSLAEDLLPHRSARTDRPETAKLVDDIRTAFAAYTDSLRRLASFVSEDQLEYLAEDPSCKICVRGLWQSKRGWAESETNGLPRVNSHLGEVVKTLKSARQTEIELKKQGMAASFGSIAVLLEVLPYIEKVYSASSILQTGREPADRRLAAILFEDFLDAFIQAIESDIAKAKVSLSKVRTSIQELDQAKTRISQASRHDSVRFAGIESCAVDKLVSDLVCECTDALTTESSIEGIAGKLEALVQDLSAVEEAFARLDDAFSKIKNLALEQPRWMHSHSGA